MCMHCGLRTRKLKITAKGEFICGDECRVSCLSFGLHNKTRGVTSGQDNELPSLQPNGEAHGGITFERSQKGDQAASRKHDTAMERFDFWLPSAEVWRIWIYKPRNRDDGLFIQAGSKGASINLQYMDISQREKSTMIFRCTSLAWRFELILAFYSVFGHCCTLSIYWWLFGFRFWITFLIFVLDFYHLPNWDCALWGTFVLAFSYA